MLATVKQLPRLADLMQELLDDKDHLANTMKEMATLTANIYDCDIPPNEEKCTKIFRPVIQTLAEKPEQDTDYILMPQLMSEDGDNEGDLQITYRSTLYKIEQLPNAHVLANTSLIRTIKEFQNLKFDEKPPLDSWAYEFAPWIEIANYRVYIPKHYCKKQIAIFLTDVLWETTWSGLEEETATQRSEEIMTSLEESIKEIDKAKEEDKLDKVTSSYNPHEELEKLIGTYELNYRDALRDTIFAIGHLLWTIHIQEVENLANILGI